MIQIQFSLKGITSIIKTKEISHSLLGFIVGFVDTD